tara:strand:- start:680 stop:1372 length:693 start_codon:yes stop_codon:yes gene_type:complete
MNDKINIAIDGYSSCGKSTIAKAISKRYQMRYIDTGAMYRAICLYCIRNNLISQNKIDERLLESHLKDIFVEFKYNAEKKTSETYLNDINIEGLIRTLEVSKSVSLISKIPVVREKLVLLQQEIGKNKNVVMDGRDIGTKVFPNADLKFFVTANPEVRAIRRFEELKKSGEKVSYDEVLSNLKMRDENDMNRKINPLRMAKDSIKIDNSYISVKDQNDFVFSHIDKILKR